MILSPVVLDRFLTATGAVYGEAPVKFHSLYIKIQKIFYLAHTDCIRQLQSIFSSEDEQRRAISLGSGEHIPSIQAEADGLRLRESGCVDDACG
jgi:hypothetical protein